MFDISKDASPVWQVGALCQAIAQVLEAQFNPLRVSGEISGFSRAASGHCYFSLKDATGQLRCAMFRRAAMTLTQMPRDGDRVEVRGRLGVYEARGDLQFIVESLQKAGQGTLFEQFLERKNRLESEGLFDPARKKPVAAMPRGIGLVTSLGAAALHDVVTALQRRAPHLPVVLVPSAVQGDAAAPELARALQALYACAQDPSFAIPVDTILLVRGGGSMEDLWAFNDENLARVIAQSPVPVIAGIGHETDFTMADFVADLRAPTPTAAAELVCNSTQSMIAGLDECNGRLQLALQRYLDRQAQNLDRIAARMGRMSVAVDRQHAALRSLSQALQHAVHMQLQRQGPHLERQRTWLQTVARRAMTSQQTELAQLQARMENLEPRRVLRRGYSWLTDTQGKVISRVAHMHPGQAVSATLHDGSAELTTLCIHHN